MGEIRRLVHPSAWTALLLAATLAGCAGGDESPAAVPSPTPAADEVEDTIRIFGIVQDAAVQPLAGATVRVPVLGLNTTTGADGRFSFDDIAPGRYVVEADAADHRQARPQGSEGAAAASPEAGGWGLTDGARQVAGLG